MGDETNSGSGVSLQQLLGGLLSAGGVAGGMVNQNNQVGILQNALSTIGPTALQGYNVSGPGGMSSGYNSSGGANINLGSLNGAFNNLSSAGTAGSGSYDPSVLSGLLSGGGSTFGSSLGNLNSAYGANNNYQNAASTQANSLGQTYNQIYGNTLGSLQAQQQPGVQQQAFGLQNSLFGRGVLDSTGAASGAIAAGNFGSQVNAMNAQDSLSAQQQALSGMQGQAGIASSLSSTGNSLLSNAFSNFGNTSQLLSGLNTQQLSNSLSALQGAGGLNTLGLNNLQNATGIGSAQATARNQSLFPYASVAGNLANTPTALGQGASALGSIGSSLLGTGGLAGLLGGSSSAAGGASGGASGLAGLLSQLFGGGSSSNQIGNVDPSLSMTSSPYTTGSDGSTYATGDLNQLFGPMDSSNSGSTGDSGLDLSQFSFNGAGGQATTPSAPTSSGTSLGGLAGAGLSAFGLASAIGYGNGIGAAGAAANLANRAGVPSSVTNPISTAASLAGTGMDLATGNYLGAASNALGLGSKAAGIPTSISQPLSLLMSILSGNPIGMGVNSLKVGGGLVNMLQGLNYNGSWSPSQAQLGQDEQQATDNGNALIASGPGDAQTFAAGPQATATETQQPAFTPSMLTQIGQNTAQNFDTSSYMDENAQNYSGQPTDMMNQGESETPIATMSQDSVDFLNSGASMASPYQTAIGSFLG